MTINSTLSHYFHSFVIPVVTKMNSITFKIFLLIITLSNQLNAQEIIKVIDRFSVQSAKGQLIHGWEEKSFVGNTKY